MYQHSVTNSKICPRLRRGHSWPGPLGRVAASGPSPRELMSPESIMYVSISTSSLPTCSSQVALVHLSLRYILQDAVADAGWNRTLIRYENPLLCMITRDSRLPQLFCFFLAVRLLTCNHKIRRVCILTIHNIPRSRALLATRCVVPRLLQASHGRDDRS